MYESGGPVSCKLVVPGEQLPYPTIHYCTIQGIDSDYSGYSTLLYNPVEFSEFGLSEWGRRQPRGSTLPVVNSKDLS